LGFPVEEGVSTTAIPEEPRYIARLFWYNFVQPVNLEVILSRVVNLETAGKDRKQLLRAIVLAVRELALQEEANSRTLDLAAFIAMALESIHDTIDVSVLAWEKRGYWIKADRFRLDWDWSGQLSEAMRQAVLGDDWAGIAATAAEVAMKVRSIKVPQRHRLGAPWEGAYRKLSQK
jgi:hypothetical protein